MLLNRRSIVERIAAEVAFEYLAKPPFQHAQNCSAFFCFQLRTFALNKQPMVAAIPGARRFYHLGKIVRRAGINFEETQKSQRAWLIVDELLEVERAFLCFFQGIELTDIIRVGFELFQAPPETNSRASEIVRSEAVVRIPQQERDRFVNLLPVRVIQASIITPSRLSSYVMGPIEENGSFRDNLRAPRCSNASKIFCAIT